MPASTVVPSVPLLYVVILNWNRPTDTIACLRSVVHSDYPNFRIVVVDNASSGDSVSRITQTFPDIALLKNEQNLGYAGGNNVGIRYALQQGAEYVLLLNDDVCVEQDTLLHLVAAASHPTVAAVGCKVRVLEEPTRLWAAGEGFSRAEEWPVDDGRFDTPREIEFAVGCCILMRSSVLEEIGLLDADLFAYFEEMEWCYRARDAGYRILYTPDAVACHKTANSLSASRSPVYHYLNTRNWLYFWERRGVIPADYRRLGWVLVVWWHETKFVIQEGDDKGIRMRAVTRGAWDYLLRRLGPPPERFFRHLILGRRVLQ
jgi:GT2 family glycosyltransferase